MEQEGGATGAKATRAAKVGGAKATNKAGATVLRMATAQDVRKLAQEVAGAAGAKAFVEKRKGHWEVSRPAGRWWLGIPRYEVVARLEHWKDDKLPREARGLQMQVRHDSVEAVKAVVTEFAERHALAVVVWDADTIACW
jgi:hypothetical protein